jgi:hypothetical protein
MHCPHSCLDANIFGLFRRRPYGSLELSNIRSRTGRSSIYQKDLLKVSAMYVHNTYSEYNTPYFDTVLWCSCCSTEAIWTLLIQKREDNPDPGQIAHNCRPLECRCTGRSISFVDDRKNSVQYHTSMLHNDFVSAISLTIKPHHNLRQQPFGMQLARDPFQAGNKRHHNSTLRHFRELERDYNI